MRLFGRGLVRLRAWLRAQAATVPASIEACEFECRETSCPPERMDGCPRRLMQVARRLAAGEPADPLATGVPIGADSGETADRHVH